jgi:diketogulonate reductase-like aldo/keto reductase
MEGDPRKEAIAAIRRALDLGATHVDTAELYGHGEVERMVGEAIEGRREDVFLVSKVHPENASRKGTILACERSLSRLRTDYLDCYLLHWPGSHPLEDTIGAFDELERAGKIRSFGVSNFDAGELTRAISIAGPGRIRENQVLYHLLERRIEREVIPLAERENVAVVGYSPFGSGNFPSSKSSGGKVLADIAESHGTSAHQITLAFLTRRPSLFAIPKASDPRHAEDNARAASIVLTEPEIARIESAFPVARQGAGVPML